MSARAAEMLTLSQASPLILSLGLAGLVVMADNWVVSPILSAIALIGVGFTFAHSTLLTIATEFAVRARGSAMSLLALCMMGGGAIGTSIGQRFIEGTSFSTSLTKESQTP